MTRPLPNPDDVGMKTPLAIALAATVFAAGTAVTTTASAAPKACDGVPKQKITKLKADNVSCATARKVANGWKRTGASKGFACGYYPIRNTRQIETVRCSKDDAVVTFKKRWVGTMPLPTYPPIQLPSTSGL